MMSVGITYFTDYAGAQKKERQVSLDALVEEIRNTTARDKASLPLLKLARFGNATTTKGSLRHDRNVISCTGCEVDYDGERFQLSENTYGSNSRSHQRDVNRFGQCSVIDRIEKRLVC